MLRFPSSQRTLSVIDRNRPRFFALGLSLFIILGFLYLTQQPALVDQAASWAHSGSTSPSSKSTDKAAAPVEKPAPPPPPPKPTRAQEISAADLLAQPLTKDLFTVPRIFHQSWKTHDPEDRQKEWIETCRKKHPDWHWVLWTDEDNQKLVEKHFPWLLDIYNAMQSNIYRADLARNLYMYTYGGVYADLDTECLRPSEAIFDSYGLKTVRGSPVASGSHGTESGSRMAFFSHMVPDWNWDDSLPNAWMASTPGHPFFLLPLQWLVDKFKGDEKAANTDPVHLTGPAVLIASILKYQKEMEGDKMDKLLEESALNKMHGPKFGSPHSVEVLKGHTIYPYKWNEEDGSIRHICHAQSDGFDREKCKAKLHVDLEGSVTIAYWSHVWG